MADLKCYACTHVLAANRPVLYACREDGDLILACGGEDHDQSTDDWKVVHPSHLFDGDPTLTAAADLREGEQAERPTVGAPWERGPIIN